MTTNPTIFAGAIGSGRAAYAGQVGVLAGHGASADEAIFEITTDDVRAAADVFRPVYDATNGVDGRVSIEVSPDLAHDTDATIAQAKELWAKVDRPNVHIKIPATKAGLPAITEVIGSGISVNVTLIFSLERYAEVIDAYLAGAREGQGCRTRPLADPLRRLVLRLARGHRGRQAPQRRSAPKRPRGSRASPASRTRAWPTSCSSASSRPNARRR